MFAALLLGADMAIGGYSLVQILKYTIIICGICGVFYVIMGVLEIHPKPWMVKIFWIVVAVFFGIIAINLLLTL